jgi:hypothetical protein
VFETNTLKVRLTWSVNDHEEACTHAYRLAERVIDFCLFSQQSPIELLFNLHEFRERWRVGNERGQDVWRWKRRAREFARRGRSATRSNELELDSHSPGGVIAIRSSLEIRGGIVGLPLLRHL